MNEAETRAELIDPALRYADRGLRHPHRRAGAGNAGAGSSMRTASGACAQTADKMRPTSTAATAQPAPVKKPTQNQTPI